MAKHKHKGRPPSSQHVNKNKPSQHDKRLRLASRIEQRRHTAEATVPLTGGVATLVTAMSQLLDSRIALRLLIVIAGAILAGGRRIAASWFRCDGVQDDWDRKPAFWLFSMEPTRREN